MEVDKKKVFNKVKHDLEVYRELILLINSILKWEQSFFPGIIGGVLTFVFLFLWYLDFSSLTLLALITIGVTILDYGYPLVSKFIFKAENWSGSQEKLYEQVIEDIVGVRLAVCGAICSFFSSRSERSTCYLIAVTVGSLILAWIGSTFNNLFLVYLVTLVLAMYPGLKEKGIVKLVFTQINNVLGNSPLGPYLKKFLPEKSAPAEKSD